VVGDLADRPPEGRGPSARYKLLSDSLQVGYRPSTFRGALLVVLLRLMYCPLEGRGPSARCQRTICPVSADRPPQPRGSSSWGCAELLSPLLLEFRFRFGIVWGLFLGLVGPLRLLDLGKLVWESLVVNLGHRLSSLFGEEFLSAPIHPPLWSSNRSFNWYQSRLRIFVILTSLRSKNGIQKLV
jgi:hypothetical protein